MKINHHNYEEYFILYMDNELGADERRMVEAFVQQHPDLKEELDLLLQYKFEPDNSVVFDGKEELLKVNGETPISLANYDEWIVLYNDNELTPAQRNMVESFMITHPSLQQEFEQLKKAKLEPETIAFAHKASLYRKEERTRPLPWLRIAAAAIFLAAIGITASLVIANKKDNSANDRVAKEEVAPLIKTTQEDIVPAPVVAEKENIAGVSEQETTPAPVIRVTNNTKLASNQKNVPKKEKSLNVIMPEQVEEEQVVAVKRNNELPTPINNRNITNGHSVNDAMTSRITPETVSKTALTNRDVTTEDPGSSDIVQASLDQSEDKKNKSRGLFRKIARTFEKRAGMDPTEDDRLLVAGLAIKLK